MTTADFDLIIIGGGIAGLWTLAHCRHQGYNAILLEKSHIGCGQSMASQGIIHGGSKYALAGIISQATNNISQMPQRWQQALNGQGSVNLSDVEQLSRAQYLVPASGIDGQLLSFLGSKSMASFTETIKAKNLPDAYQAIGIQRNCFRLNEMVIDTGSLFASLLKQFNHYIYQVDVKASAIQQESDSVSIQLDGLQLRCKRLIQAAGEGNAQLPQAGSMQTRPLQMVMLKDKNLQPIYAHFIGRSSKPLLTVTSHNRNGENVWYMGGNLAETGVDFSAEKQINESRKLLKKLLPRLQLSTDAQFSTLNINRAEPQQSSLLRPDDAHVVKSGNIISGWPTKLALAPRFAEQVEALLDLPTPTHSTAAALNLPHATIADFPWSTLWTKCPY